MKKKLILLLSCLALAGTASAQSYYESDSDIYGLGQASYEKKWHRDLGLCIGSQVEAGISFRRDFGKYFAWDVVGIGYAYDYMNASLNPEEGIYSVSNVKHECKLRTGFRGFTPKLGNIKFFAGIGFSCEALRYEDETARWSYYYDDYYDYDTYDHEAWSSSPGLGIDVQVGVCLSKTVSIGYKAEFHRLALGAKGCDHNDHMARITFSF